MALTVTYSSNLIQTMTSNTAPSGVASCSTVYTTGYEAYKAFDGSTATYWDSADTITTGWLCYQFPSLQKIAQYTIKSNNLPTQAPKTWTFEGSNNGSTWTILDTRTNETSWGSKEKRTYQFTNANNYIYYRINVSANNGGGLVSIGEMEMMSRLTQTGYLIQDKNSILRTLDESGNLIDSPSQTLDEDNYLTNGFNDVTQIPIDQLKTLGNLSDFKLLMYTDDLSKEEAKLVGTCDPFDLTQWLKDNECSLKMWTDDTTKTEATMTYELLSPYKPIDILKKNNGGKFEVLMKEI